MMRSCGWDGVASGALCCVGNESIEGSEASEVRPGVDVNAVPRIVVCSRKAQPLMAILMSATLMMCVHMNVSLCDIFVTFAGLTR
eukprot:1160890-Pelagomonas_calceolata.AAC.6